MHIASLARNAPVCPQSHPLLLQGQVLVRNEFASVNMIDTYHRTGLYARASYPSGLGEEGAGTVEAVGPGETHARTPWHAVGLSF